MRWAKTVIYENDEQFLRSFAIEPIAEAVLQDLKRGLENQASKTFNYARLQIRSAFLLKWCSGNASCNLWRQL